MEKEDSLMGRATQLMEAIFMASRNPQVIAKIKHKLKRGKSSPHDILNRTTDEPFGKAYDYNQTPSYTTKTLA